MKRLLLVEDDRSLGATLAERLEREKYEVYWAQTQQRALKKLSEGLWDLVILDIGLPDGSGFELARHIKQSTSLPIMSSRISIASLVFRLDIVDLLLVPMGCRVRGKFLFSFFGALYILV